MHGVSFETARRVFDDPRAVSIQGRHKEGEEPWQTIGRVSEAVILLVTHTHRSAEGRGGHPNHLGAKSDAERAQDL
jgi:uncharacterized DUF497 family protein